MSRRINVNPGQYKVAGRERQGEDIDQPREKAELARAVTASRSRRKGFVPPRKTRKKG
jgi:hypothetical protein